MNEKRLHAEMARLHHGAAWFHECAPTRNQGVTSERAWALTTSIGDGVDATTHEEAARQHREREAWHDAQ